MKSGEGRRVLMINGPNLNLLGRREPGIYGETSLAAIEGDLQVLARQKGLVLQCFQSNHEGELIDRIHKAMSDADFIIINPGAFTHYSIALFDALRAAGIPFIEIHISNIFAREEFRHHSLISPLASGIIAGLGTAGYRLAFHAVADILLAGKQNGA